MPQSEYTHEWKKALESQRGFMKNYTEKGKAVLGNQRGFLLRIGLGIYPDLQRGRYRNDETERDGRQLDIAKYCFTQLMQRAGSDNSHYTSKTDTVRKIIDGKANIAPRAFGTKTSFEMPNVEGVRDFLEARLDNRDETDMKGRFDYNVTTWYDKEGNEDPGRRSGATYTAEDKLEWMRYWMSPAGSMEPGLDGFSDVDREALIDVVARAYVDMCWASMAAGTSCGADDRLRARLDRYVKLWADLSDDWGVLKAYELKRSGKDDPLSGEWPFVSESYPMVKSWASAEAVSLESLGFSEPMQIEDCQPTPKVPDSKVKPSQEPPLKDVAVFGIDKRSNAFDGPYLAAQSAFLKMLVGLHLTLENQFFNDPKQIETALAGLLRRLSFPEKVIEKIDCVEWIDAFNGTSWVPRAVTYGYHGLLESLYGKAYDVFEEDLARLGKPEGELASYCGCGPDAYLENIAEAMAAVFERVFFVLPIRKQRKQMDVSQLDVAAVSEALLDDMADRDEMWQMRRARYLERFVAHAPVNRKTIEMGCWGEEPISWIVAEVDEGSRALLVSEKVIDCLPYNESWFEYERIGWEECSLREWLNGTFLDTAFDPDTERARIIPRRLEGSDDLKTLSGGRDLSPDFVFCLSTDELVRVFGGDFHGRVAVATSFAKSRYIEAHPGSDDYSGFIGTEWWLRSPSESISEALTVYDDGEIERCPIDVPQGVRPAIWLDLQADSDS